MTTLAPPWDVALDPDSLRVPIFVAHGRYDYAVPSPLWSDVVAKLPTATLRIFDRSGHHPFFEEPERFTAALMEWMDNSRPLAKNGQASIEAATPRGCG